MKNKYYLFLILILFLSFTLKTNAQSQFQDELIKNKKAEINTYKNLHNNSIIEDELTKSIKSNNNHFDIFISKYDNKEDSALKDELITPEFIKNHKRIKNASKYNKICDELEEHIINKSKIVKRIHPKTYYDFTKKLIPINIKVAQNLVLKSKKITNKNNDKNIKTEINEGETISFYSTHAFCIKGKIYPQNTVIEGRVETISPSDKMGVPENIVIDNFYIKDNPNILLHGKAKKTGANRSIWVYPLYQAGNITLYVAGFVFVPIHGGHAKILAKDTFTVYYEPN